MTKPVASCFSGTAYDWPGNTSSVSTAVCINPSAPAPGPPVVITAITLAEVGGGFCRSAGFSRVLDAIARAVVPERNLDKHTLSCMIIA